MKKIFRGVIPDGLLYDMVYDMWVRRAGEEVFIGATAYGIFLAGEVIAFTAKPRGAVVEPGRGLGVIECAKTVMAVHAPVGFILVEGNEALERSPMSLNADAYSAWMVRGRPSHWERDRAHLVDAAAYRAHVRQMEPDAECT
jgi:glycine cleavage system H protein